MKNLLQVDEATVLIVDDQSTSRTILAQVVKGLHPNITVIEKHDPEAALEWAADNTADLILVDYLMPEMNGIDFVRMIKTIPDYHYIPIIMITIKKDADTRNEALEAGVTDFLIKPVDIQECSARSRNLLVMRQQQQSLENRSQILESLVDTATEEIRAREKETLMRLARIGEYKDYETARHLLRMSLYVKILAEEIGLSKDEVETLELAAPLHDIGKIGIPDKILLKPGALDDEELKVMRTHPMLGYQVLQDSPSKYLQKGAEIALYHHEKFDGTGYPNGLAGKDIPISARLVAVADVFDALTSKRSYKEAWTIEDSLSHMKKQSGKHFDPDIVETMFKVKPRFERVLEEHAS